MKRSSFSSITTPSVKKARTAGGKAPPAKKTKGKKVVKSARTPPKSTRSVRKPGKTTSPSTTTLQGHTVVVTGTVPGETRVTFDAWLAAQGAQGGKGVTRQTSILLVAETPGVVKIQDAEEKITAGQTLEIISVPAFAVRYGLPYSADVEGGP